MSSSKAPKTDQNFGSHLTMARKSVMSLIGLTCVITFLTSPALHAAENQIKELIVFPTEVSLTNQQDRQTMVIQAVYENGMTDDV